MNKWTNVLINILLLGVVIGILSVGLVIAGIKGHEEWSLILSTLLGIPLYLVWQYLLGLSSFLEQATQFPEEP